MARPTFTFISPKVMLLLRKSFRLGKMSIVPITHAAKETTHSMKPVDIRHDPLISNVLVVFQNGLEISLSNNQIAAKRIKNGASGVGSKGWG